MNTLQILLFVAIGVSLVVTFIMKMPSASRRGARKLLGATPWLADDSADGAMVKVTGVVRMREHGERFMSPLSENRCVVLRLRVQVRHGVDPRAKLIEDFKIMPFLVEDADGKLLVDAEHALLDIPPVKQTSKATPRKSQLLTELGHEEASSSASEIEETLVEVGATVTVAGTLAKSAEGMRLVGTKDRPLAIRVERVFDVNEP
ncbi:MAG: hypothetical protein M4D80_09790 [Myxococcota bacterium]|nr:hypothetical protein [Myxococcota bacterium]